MSDGSNSKNESIRNLIMTIAALLFSATLFDAIYGFKNLIDPGISLVYNSLGTAVAPNMVTMVVFDWRGFDTLGEALILVTAVVVLLIFGRGQVKGDKSESTEKTNLNLNSDENSSISPILKILTLPISIIMIALGVITILGGHITPGGGFQGGAMIAAGIIFCILVYGVNKSPIKLSHGFISTIETLGALAFIVFGLIGLFYGGSFLYNFGSNVYGFVSPAIASIFQYPDPTNAGILPYLNIFVGLKVFVGLSAIVIAFLQFKKYLGDEE